MLFLELVLSISFHVAQLSNVIITSSACNLVHMLFWILERELERNIGGCDVAVKKKILIQIVFISIFMLKS